MPNFGQKLEKPDDIRDMINRLSDIVRELDKIYMVLEDNEQTALSIAILKIGIAQRKMGKRLLRERLKQAMIP